MISVYLLLDNALFFHLSFAFLSFCYVTESLCAKTFCIFTLFNLKSLERITFFSNFASEQM